MSSDDQRVSVADLDGLTETIHIDDLNTEGWPESPWSGDVGARAVQSAEFGNLETVYHYQGDVLHGADIVTAERFESLDDGQVNAVDLAKAGWSRERSQAWVLSIRTHYDRDRADPYALAELVTSLAPVVPEATVAAGFDGDALDVLLSAVDQIDTGSFADLPDTTPGPGEGGAARVFVTCPNCHEEFDPGGS